MMHFIAKILRHALMILMGALVLSVTWQVLSRYVLDQPASWTEEAARFLLVWVGVLGAAAVSYSREHLAIDLLPRRLQGRRALALRVFIECMVLGFALVAMVVGGSRLVLITWELNQLTPALGLPTAVLYLVVPLSGVLMVLFSGVQIMTLLSQSEPHLSDSNTAMKES
jgi:TRAP-type C4-dicarboxylate transport system permease small subunit